MKTVVLSGELGRLFGREHVFDIATPAEAIRALCANFKGFKEHLSKAHERNVGYKVITAGEALAKVEDTLLPAGKIIKIVPVIMGANAGARILIGATLIAAGFAIDYLTGGAGTAFTTGLKTAGFSMVLGGVIEMLSPVPKVKGPAERPENQPSYSFNGPVNTTAQGHPVPLAYGRVICGSAIVSAGISVEQIKAGLKRVRVLLTNFFYTLTDGTTPYSNALFGITPPPTVFVSRTFVEDTSFNEIGGGSTPVKKWSYTYYEFQVVPA